MRIKEAAEKIAPSELKMRGTDWTLYYLVVRRSQARSFSDGAAGCATNSEYQTVVSSLTGSVNIKMHCSSIENGAEMVTWFVQHNAHNAVAGEQQGAAGLTCAVDTFFSKNFVISP